MSDDLPVESDLLLMEEVRLLGTECHPLLPWPLKLLQVLTGYVLLRSVLWLVGRFLLGYRVDTRLSFDGTSLRIQRNSWVLGRSVRASEELFRPTDLLSIGLETRFPYLLLLLGSLGTVLGAIVGVGWVVDGIEASYLPLLFLGFGALATGIALDVIVSSLMDYLGGRVSVVIGFNLSRWVLFPRRHRIVGVDETSAKRFINTVFGR